ncbi:MAG: general stress protein CsbD [Bacteroidota bacterium]|nr:general stress protein CsbD [Bacteroidota bacterium]
MDKLNFSKNINSVRERLKARYPTLTESDLEYTEGEEDAFLGRIEKRLGGNKRQEIINLIKTL